MTFSGNGTQVYVDGCVNRGQITITTKSSGAGGIVGVMGDAYYSIVRNCVNYGNMTVTAGGSCTSLGGIIGRQKQESHLYNCINVGDILNLGVGSEYIGGVVGFAAPYTSICNRVCAGRVKGSCFDCCRSKQLFSD